MVASLLGVSCSRDSKHVDAQPRSPNTTRTAATIQDLAYGPDPDHRLDLRTPEGNGPHPVIVWIHGGGFVGGDENDLPGLVAAQVDRGFAVASLRHRLAPAHPFPAAVRDAKRAVRWLKSRAERYRLDADRVVAWGHSSGATLASMVALTPGILEPTVVPRGLSEQSSAVVAFVVEAGPTDLTTWWWQSGASSLSSTLAYFACAEIYTCSRRAMLRASPVHWVDPSDPPGYLAYVRQDPLVDAELQGQPLRLALLEANGPDGVLWDLVDADPESAGAHYPEPWIDLTALECFLDRSVDRPETSCG